jgi:wobble nucleotide-excising tRNase
MSQSKPAKALNGVRSGHICDRCNKRVRTGDLIRAYATHYDRDGWVIRRVWCEGCGESAIGEETDEADEVIFEAVFWKHRLVSVEVRNRSR